MSDEEVEVFTVGEVVALTCGGPPMTIVEADGSGTYGAVWFDDEGQMQKAQSIPGAALQSGVDPESTWSRTE